MQRYVGAGLRPEIDVLQEKAAAATARTTLVSAQNDYEIAKAQLNQAMGVERDTEYDVADESVPAVAGEDDSTDALLDEALRTRPELAVLASQRRVQVLTVDNANRAYYPTLRASTGVSGGPGLPGYPGWSWRPSASWDASISLSWTIYDGGARDASVRDAEAALVAFDAQAVATRQQIRLDIERARLAVRGGRETLAAASDALDNAQALLHLAEQRYANGMGSIIELGDAQLALTRAEGTKIQAEYNLATARGELLDALGRP